MADLEVLCGKAQPSQIAMNPKLLGAATSGDIGSLDELLQQYYPSGASGEQIAITIPEDAETQKVTNFLLGVTPAGNTALHIAASRGNLEFAEKICRREKSLLEAPNMRLDTPLHHAARAGHHNIVSLIIRFAREDWIEARRVLRATNMEENNALHEAAKYNHASVATALIEKDVELASMLNDAGMSPLYLAIVTGSLEVAKALLQSSSMERASPASYAGPDKKTVLHAAVLLSPEIIEEMLQKKPMLTKCADSSGRTPLHYAASDGHNDTVKILLDHDPSAAYVSDADGLFPIHVAASMGNVSTVSQILQQCRETYELLDREGKNFLHVAFKRRELNVVKKIISERPDLRKMLNDRDNEGNTSLHTAVENSDEHSVYFLLQDKTVNIDVTNHDGFTPLDLSFAKVEKDLHFVLGVDDYILWCLGLIKAKPGPRQLHGSKKIKLSSDEVERESSSVTQKNENEEAIRRDQELKKDQQISEKFAIVSVLVATVTFAASFTMPGGYIADDHPGGGTAVLAKEYAFKVFVVADTFAFVFSTLATLWFAYAGVLIVDKQARRRNLILAILALWVSIAGMAIAFGMGVYVSFAPRRKGISILVCTVTLASPLLTPVMEARRLYPLMTTVVGRRLKQWGDLDDEKRRHSYFSFVIAVSLITLSLTAIMPMLCVMAVLFSLAKL